MMGRTGVGTDVYFEARQGRYWMIDSYYLRLLQMTPSTPPDGHPLYGRSVDGYHNDCFTTSY